MSDIELVIKIPEEKLSLIKNKSYCGLYDSDLYKAIANGTPLDESVDAISRQAVLDAFGLSENTRKYGGDHSGYDTLMKYEIQDVVEELPPVNPQPKVGHWIVYDVHGHKACKCSECDKDAGYPCYDKYCSHCGSYNGGERI